MVNVKDFGQYETAWCPGCGNFQILESVKEALAGLDIPPHKTLLCSGIGQAAKLPHYLTVNVFNGLHGRGLPVAQGAALANSALTVINESGDGCNYGEGGNHFLGAIRRNVDMTLIVHDNQIYGLTKGQASPMTMRGQKTKAQPNGVLMEPFNPLATAIIHNVGFVARSFSGNKELTVRLIQEAIKHPGFALVDIMQPCVSFNKVNTFSWYKEHCKELPARHDATDRSQALEKALDFGETIWLGVYYRSEAKKSYQEQVPALAKTPLCRQPVDKAALREVMASFV